MSNQLAEAENPRAVAGDNNPPDPLIVEFNERLDTAQRWLDERKEILDESVADRCAFFISQIAGTHKALDDQRKNENRAFKKAQDDKYDAPLTLLESAKAKLLVLRNAWLKKKQDKLDAERAAAQAEADRIAAEAAATLKRAQEEEAKKGRTSLRTEQAVAAAQEAVAEAAAKVEAVPARAQIRGTYTTHAVSLRDYYWAEVVDLGAAFKHYKGNADVLAAIREAITKVATDEAKALKDLTKAPPGCIFRTEKR